MPRRAGILTPTVFVAALSSCGTGSGEAPDAGFDCEVEQRDDVFVAGMEKTGTTGMTFRLVSSDPAPPARNDNAWVIEIEDAAGAPLEAADVEVTPFMPDHGHGTGIPAIVTPSSDVAGRYDVDPVNLFMPALWDITIRATPAGGTAADRDQGVYRFCISS